ncbi:MAG TPA: transaldolase [Gemmatimonadota bacterium]|nr:transaldolase [Gemmatimonadota bacterium]
MPSPLIRLHDLGQQIWLDYIRRDILEDGTLARLIADDGLAGMTSNPTIFQQAIAETDLYDEDVRAAGADAEPQEVFERLAVADIRAACDHFRERYESSGGREGYVSIEVNPHLAKDTGGTLEEVHRLWRAVDRPNVMVKIPGTEEGLPAIRDALAAGVNINITLLFSVQRYHAVMDAWFEAMEGRLDRGEPVGRVFSVASFFVSRVDSKVDARLETLLERAGTEEEREHIRSFMGKIAIDNARIAYSAYEARFAGGGFDALVEAGAAAQMPLWASTSTKNPEFPDVYYVESLIAPGTVNTLPPDTIDAYRDHGDPAVRIREDLNGAYERREALAELGVELSTVTDELEEEGVRKFADSYDALLEAIAEKQRQVQPA